MYFPSTGCDSLASGLTLGHNCCNCPPDMGLGPKYCTNGYQGAVAPGCLRLTPNYKGRICGDHLSSHNRCMSLCLHTCTNTVRAAGLLMQPWRRLILPTMHVSLRRGCNDRNSICHVCFVSSFVSNSELLGKNYTIILNGWMAANFKVKTGKWHSTASGVSGGPPKWCNLWHTSRGWQATNWAHPIGATCGTRAEGDKTPTGPTQLVQPVAHEQRMTRHQLGPPKWCNLWHTSRGWQATNWANTSGATCGTRAEGDKPPTGPTQLVQPVAHEQRVTRHQLGQHNWCNLWHMSRKWQATNWACRFGTQMMQIWLSLVYAGWRHWGCKRKCDSLLVSSDKTRSSTVTGFKPLHTCSIYIHSVSH